MNSKYLALDFLFFFKISSGCMCVRAGCLFCLFVFVFPSDLYPFILAHVLYELLKSTVYDTTHHW